MDPEERKRRKAAYQRQWYQDNKERVAAYDRDYASRNREAIRAYHKTWRESSGARLREISRKYDITVEFYLRLITTYPVCCICGRSPEEAHSDGYPLAIDHCHTSGKIRGLLCRHCNMALGQFEDRPERLRAAADYLEVSRASDS